MSSYLNDADISGLLESESEPTEETEIPYDSGGGSDLPIVSNEEASLILYNNEEIGIENVVIIINEDGSGFESVSSNSITNESEITQPVLIDDKLIKNDINTGTVNPYSVVVNENSDAIPVVVVENKDVSLNELDIGLIDDDTLSTADQTLINEPVNDENVVCNGIDELPTTNKVRKKIPAPKTWKVNVRKAKHNAGKEYLNQKGKLVLKKEIKTKKDCLNRCKFNCSKKITADERKALFDGYYNLKDHDSKSLYLLNCTDKSIAARKQRKPENETPSRREFSFRYFLNVKNTRIQVCKTFFLTTLNISQKPIYNVHKNKDPHTNLPKADQRGQKASTRIPEYAKNDVRNHIKSFPVIESHYCRRDTVKQYLDSYLSISKMYSMFKEKYPSTVIKESKYRQIFVNEFNLDFHVPKSDRCDICEEHKMSVRENLPVDLTKYETHIKTKDAMRSERNKDRENQDTAVLCYDLQNVITCPRAEISCFFYMRKLNVYNMTAHLKTKNGKKAYCAIWTELTGGRSGNDIASAVFSIVKRVLNHFPCIEDLVTWSDSCVPQNRNQMMTGAMMLTLQQNPKLRSITMKYSTPGHGAVQEVDNIHSHIEKAFMAKEFYSPISLIRILTNVNKKTPYTVIQLSDKDFLNFSSSSKELMFNLVPFSVVSTIILTQTFGEIKYSTEHQGLVKTVNVKPEIQTRGNKAPKTKPPKENKRSSHGSSTSSRKRKQQSSSSSVKELSPQSNNDVSAYKPPPKVSGNAHLQAEKKRDLQRMLKFMPLVDRDYYNAIYNA